MDAKRAVPVERALAGVRYQHGDELGREFRGGRDVSADDGVADA